MSKYQGSIQGYNTHVTGRHILVTDAMKDYALDKLSKVDRFCRDIIDVNITMDIQKTEHRIDVVLKVGHITIKVHASSEDMYASIDKVMDKLQRRLRKYKSRLTEHHAKALSIVDMDVNVIRNPSEDLDEINDAIEEANKEDQAKIFKPEVVKREKQPLKTLTLDEAVMKLDLSDESFLIFKAEEDQKIKVIYRREDNYFGVVEPEKLG